jgi:hypothetical protein
MPASRHIVFHPPIRGESHARPERTKEGSKRFFFREKEAKKLPHFGSVPPQPAKPQVG